MAVYDVTLDKAEWSEVLNLTRKFKATRLDRNELFELTREWEARPTVASKRIFTFLALVIATAIVVGIDFAELDLWGLTPPEEGVERFVQVLKLILLGAGFSFGWNLFVDYRYRKARLIDLELRISRAQNLMNEIGLKIGAENAAYLPEVRFIHKDGKVQPVSFKERAGDKFAVISFYEKQLKNPGIVRKWLKRLEVVLIGSVGIFAFTYVG